MRIATLAISFLLCTSVGSAARAEEAVEIGGGWGGGRGLLNKPAKPKGSIILIPGGNGQLGVQPDGSFSGLRGNQLVRTRQAYASSGLASLTIDYGVSLPAAIAYMRKIASPVVVVATSRGSLRVPGSLSGSPDGIVLTASFLDQVQSSIGSSSALPPTLVVHHRQDGCRFTLPTLVEPFKSWGGAKVRVVWMDGGSNDGDPCEARAYHGFNGQDGRVVSAVSAFAKSLK